MYLICSILNIGKLSTIAVLVETVIGIGRDRA